MIEQKILEVFVFLINLFMEDGFNFVMFLYEIFILYVYVYLYINVAFDRQILICGKIYNILKEISIQC